MEDLKKIIEAIIFVSGNPISAKDIAEKLYCSEKEVMKCAKELQEKYTADSGVNLLIYNNKLQFCSNPKFADAVSNVLNPIRERELSRSMLEVAAIIAYKQPVTRLDLERIRGVSSEYAIQTLLKLGIIEITGRRDTIGKPAEFGTTDEFLKKFQISSLEELPDFEEMMNKINSEVKEESNYLYKKDTYTPDDKSLALDDEIAYTTEVPDINEEEMPDFLNGEKIEQY